MAELFKSFLFGGFECATHRRRDGRQIDVIDVTQHDRRAAEDYQLLLASGIRTVRDGFRWHRIESSRGRYDWSSFLPMLDASRETGMQVIWDLCHWGVPDDVNLFSPSFITRFADFARAAATLVAERTTSVPFYCPINEISFWAWVGGDEAHFGPHWRGRGPELKRQLVRASLAAIRAIREVDPRARFVQAEPMIQISAGSDIVDDAVDAARHTESQYEAWDLLRGDDFAEDDAGLGGSFDALDIVGVNYYWNNQWIHRGELTPPGHALHVPLHQLLRRVWERYRRPIVITETGTEDAGGVGWLGYVAAEVRQAQREDIPIEGVCLYPVMDYPGWDDDRHCPCGLIAIDDQWQARTLRPAMVQEVQMQAAFSAIAAGDAVLPGVG